MFAALWSQLVELFLQNQMAVFVAVTSVLTSFVMWIASRKIPGFAGLGDKVKVAITAVSAILVTLVVQLLGGTPDGGLNLATIIFGSSVSFGAATAGFKLAKTQPSSNLQFAHLQDTGTLPPRMGG